MSESVEFSEEVIGRLMDYEIFTRLSYNIKHNHFSIDAPSDQGNDVFSIFFQLLIF